MWNRIRHRHNRREPEQPLLITLHHSPLIRPFASGILHIVKSLTIRLPNINLDVLNRLPIGILDRTEHEARLPVRIVCYLGAIGAILGLMRVEGSENSPLGAGWRFGMVDAVDEEGEADDVGEEDEFLSDVGADLADLGEELYTCIGRRYESANSISQCQAKVSQACLLL